MIRNALMLLALTATSGGGAGVEALKRLLLLTLTLSLPIVGPASAGEPSEAEIRYAILSSARHSFSSVNDLKYKVFEGNGSGRISTVGSFITEKARFRQLNLLDDMRDYFTRDGYSKKQVALAMRALTLIQDHRRIDDRPYLLLTEELRAGAEVPFRAEITYFEQVDGFSFSGRPEYTLGSGQSREIADFNTAAKRTIVKPSSEYSALREDIAHALNVIYGDEHFKVSLGPRSNGWHEMILVRTGLCTYWKQVINGKDWKKGDPWVIEAEFRLGGEYAAPVTWNVFEKVFTLNSQRSINGWRFRSLTSKPEFVYIRMVDRDHSTTDKCS